MAETPISGLTALATTPATGDLFVVVDVSDTTQAATGTTKKITAGVVFTSPTFTTPTVTGLATLNGGATAAAPVVFTGTTIGAAGTMWVGPSAGGTFINAPTGSTVRLAINNTDIVTAAGTSVTMGQVLVTILSGTGSAGFRLPHGAAPTSPVNGDMWSTTAGLFIYINGVSKTVTLT